MLRTADAEWKGSLKAGGGEFKLGSGVYEGKYSFASRFESGKGTNPEELIAAAHSACFSMALSVALEQAGHVPDRVHTVARVHLERDQTGFLIQKIELATEVKAPGLTNDKLQELATAAKKNCPISRALAAVPAITLDAKLVS
jgi:osmotically inducible protein OsmC